MIFYEWQLGTKNNVVDAWTSDGRFNNHHPQLGSEINLKITFINIFSTMENNSMINNYLKSKCKTLLHFNPRFFIKANLNSLILTKIFDVNMKRKKNNQKRINL